MCSRPARPARSCRRSSPLGVLVAVPAADALVAAGAERPAAVARRRPVAGEQHAADVGDMRAWSSAVYSSSTVCGRKALRTSGRSNAMRTVPCSTARWYVMSVKSKPGTAVHADGSNSVGHTVAQSWPSASLRPFCARGYGASRDRAARSPRVDGLPEIEPGADLAALDRRRAPTVADGDVVVVTSKIVSKAEGRTVELADVDAVGVRHRLGDDVGQGPAPRRGRAARGEADRPP